MLHDVRYDGTEVLYRMSVSDMVGLRSRLVNSLTPQTVPYGDPRSPYHRKQAFDLGDVSPSRHQRRGLTEIVVRCRRRCERTELGMRLSRHHPIL